MTTTSTTAAADTTAVGGGQPNPVQVLVATLIARRRKLGLTQGAVAKRMFVTRAMVGMLESGGRRPHLDTAVAWADALGLQLQLHEPIRPSADALIAAES